MIAGNFVQSVVDYGQAFADPIRDLPVSRSMSTGEIL
jgi:hypothetical protein